MITEQTLIAIAVMATIVYLTRAGGYLLGLQIRHIQHLKPVLEALPGCAFMAILTPIVWQGSATEILAMACVLNLMWVTNSVVLATVVGMTVLLFAEHDIIAFMDYFHF